MRNHAADINSRLAGSGLQLYTNMSGSEAGVQFLMKFWIICFMFARTSCKVVLFDTLTAPSDISCCVYMLANCWAALMLLRSSDVSKAQEISGESRRCRGVRPSQAGHALCQAAPSNPSLRLWRGRS